MLVQQKSHHIPWVEKYRPQCVDDIAHQEEARMLLKRIIATGMMPNLLFYGPPGTGKTSAVHALSKELYGENWRTFVLELNASDDRGIGVVRDKIKMWTKNVVAAPKQSAPDENGVTKLAPSWKIVILDEADMMTVDAQSALRRLMEDTAKNTRFAIICNFVSRIIGPIASRCAKFRFEPISREAQRHRLQLVTSKECLSCNTDAIEKVLDISQGDMRVCMTLLQTTSRVYGNEFTADNVTAVAGYPPPQVAGNLLIVCKDKLKSHGDVETVVDRTIQDGWDVGLILKQIGRAVVLSQCGDVQKAEILLSIAQSSHRLLQGCNEYLQLLFICLHMHQVFGNAPPKVPRV